MRLREIGCCLLVAGVSFGATGCEKSEPKKEEAPPPASAQAPKDELDPALAKALAESKAQAGSAPTNTAGGPPAKGVFGPGGADKEAKPNSPPKITLGSTGSDPKVRLTPGLGTSEGPIKARIMVAMQAAPNQGALPVQFDIDFTSKKADPKATQSDVTAKVVTAGMPAEVSGQAPPALNQALAKLRGSTVQFQQWSDGGATGFHYDAPKDAPRELVDIVHSLSDAIATAVLPVPPDAVGAGGYWMATSRDGVMGLDLVTYRMVKVVSVQGNTATLSVNTKRYAASSNFAMEGLPGKFTLDELASGGEGQLAYQAGRSIPASGGLELVLAASLIPEGQPDQRGTLQLASKVVFSERTPAAAAK